MAHDGRTRVAVVHLMIDQSMDGPSFAVIVKLAISMAITACAPLDALVTPVNRLTHERRAFSIKASNTSASRHVNSKVTMPNLADAVC